ncbi:hypothetical protein NUU61_000695 [Penicillium alfredii]|uniref:Uncharacterized protein n=1 Tax=Penicillium alfredii TaxID=1506179 RepID=A0A9W9GA84_9EURO|nr:uncharacterized protein NUU61_000695 [Penicillium alfredii]KAJ5114936.1 hypothetical protein NUU61_000695 [Penicillium alfredii]
MLSPTYPYATRMPPPVRPSRSLEGLEQVIPPKMPLSPTRSELFLNKPLPAKPLPEAPIECSAIWSDSSDSDSTVDTVGSPSEPRNSTESYPIFVSSGSDDFGDLVDPPAPSADPVHLGSAPLSPQRFIPAPDPHPDSLDSRRSSIIISRTSTSDPPYAGPSPYTPHRAGANHYFREKKWDFFPELATPSALQASGRVSPGIQPGNRRKKDGRLNLPALDFSKGRSRWHSLDRAGLGLVHVRDSVKTYVLRTLSRDSPETKPKESPRPATAPINPTDPQSPTSFTGGSERLHNGWATQNSSVGVNAQLRVLSVATEPTAGDYYNSPRTIPSHRPKQLAVPMSPYQKYGSSIWETPKKSKKRSVRFPKYSKSAPASGPSSPQSYTNATPPLSSPLKMQFQQNTREAVRALQDGTSHVLVALDGAKKKIIDCKEDRRREQLKSQIKVVGPTDPHNCKPDDPWF